MSIIVFGYVSLPLAVEFGKIYPAIGIDLSEKNRLPSTSRWFQRKNDKPRIWSRFTGGAVLPQADVIIAAVATNILYLHYWRHIAKTQLLIAALLMSSHNLRLRIL